MDNLAFIQKFRAAINEEALTKGEFTQAFEKVVLKVLKMEEANLKAIELLEQRYEQLAAFLDDKTTTSTNDLKTQVNGLFVQERVDEMKKEHKKLMQELKNQIDDKLSMVTDGEPGKPGEKGERGERGSPDTAQDIKNKLTTIGIEVETVNGLKEILKNIDAKAGRVVRGAPPNANAVQTSDLSSQCDGQNKTFYVPRHRVVLGLACSQFPFLYRPIVDFSTANTVLTLTDEVSPPEAGQTLIFTYVK